MAARRGPRRSRCVGSNVGAIAPGLRWCRRPTRPEAARHLAASRGRDRPLRPAARAGLNRRMARDVRLDVKVLAFDVFGTVVDWRGGITAEVSAIAAKHDLAIDAGALADEWRRRYQPFLDRVRLGETPWQGLDDLHRAALREALAQFSLEALPETDVDRLVFTSHRLPPWPDPLPGLTRLRARFLLATLPTRGVAVVGRLARAACLPVDC